MKNIWVPFPPEDEQLAIVHFLDWKRSVFNSIIPEKAITKGNIIASSRSLLAREMTLIDEYRTRLFSDVVTGAIDIRDIIVPEFDAVNDLEYLETSENDNDDVTDVEEE